MGQRIQIARSLSYLIAISVCGSASFADVKLQVDEPSVITSFDTKTSTPIKAGTLTSLVLKAPAMVTSDKKIPLLLIPVYSENATLNLSAPLLSTVVQRITEEEMGARLSLILAELADVQSLIRNRELDRALDQINALRTRNPQVKFLDFPKASILLLKGQRAEAQALTENALKEYPNYKEGQNFLHNLKGGP